MQARRLRYVLISSFLVQYSAVRAATLVHPQRDDLAGRSFLEIGIPLETYTNGLVFYMDAAAGDYNAGAADYFIPDLSTNRHDAIQTGTGYQPARVYTNGAWAYQFDGTDDKVITASPIIPATNDFFIEVIAVPNAASTGLDALFSQYISQPAEGRCFVFQEGNAVRVFIGSAGGHVDISGGTLSTTSDSVIALSRSSNVFELALNGVSLGKATNEVSVLQRALYIGETEYGTQNFNGKIKSLKLSTP